MSPDRGGEKENERESGIDKEIEERSDDLENKSMLHCICQGIQIPVGGVRVYTLLDLVFEKSNILPTVKPDVYAYCKMHINQ